MGILLGLLFIFVCYKLLISLPSSIECVSQMKREQIREINKLIHRLKTNTDFRSQFYDDLITEGHSHEEIVEDFDRYGVPLDYTTVVEIPTSKQ